MAVKSFITFYPGVKNINLFLCHWRCGKKLVRLSLESHNNLVYVGKPGPAWSTLRTPLHTLLTNIGLPWKKLDKHTHSTFYEAFSMRFCNY
jgi:hypothetical protein